MNNRYIAVFGWNHEGLGHISRLTGINNMANEMYGYKPFYFVQHEQDLINDYKFSQVILPSYKGALIGDEWWTGKTLGVSREVASTISKFSINQSLEGNKGVILFDVVVNRDLYEWGIKNDWPMALVFRERKDITDPVQWVKTTTPHIKKIYWVGKEFKKYTESGIDIITVPSLVRKRIGDNSVWKEKRSENEVNILITSGGGGHPDAQSFLQTAIDGVELASMKTSKKINLTVILGAYFKKSLEFNPSKINIKIMPYLSPEYSQYNQSDILICQGGYNTVNECLYEDVCVLAIPAQRALDDQKQRIIRILDKKDNSMMSECNGEKISEKLIKIMNNLNIKSKVCTLDKDISEGTKKVAMDIHETMEKKWGSIDELL